MSGTVVLHLGSSLLSFLIDLTGSVTGIRIHILCGVASSLGPFQGGIVSAPVDTSVELSFLCQSLVPLLLFLHHHHDHAALLLLDQGAMFHEADCLCGCMITMSLTDTLGVFNLLLQSLCDSCSSTRYSLYHQCQNLSIVELRCLAQWVSVLQCTLKVSSSSSDL